MLYNLCIILEDSLRQSTC